MANWWDSLVPSGSAKGKMSGAEDRELSNARQANQDGRNVFHQLANLYRTASRYPGGIPNNVADSWGAALGFKGDQVQDQQLFRAQAGQQAVSQAKLLAPVSNSDFQNLVSFGPNPALRFDNNKELIGQRYEDAARRYFENAFKQRWAAKNNGLNGVDAQGRSYADALNAAMTRPDVQQELTAPWKRKTVPGGVPPQASQPAVDPSQFKVIR